MSRDPAAGPGAAGGGAERAAAAEPHRRGAAHRRAAAGHEAPAAGHLLRREPQARDVLTFRRRLVSGCRCVVVPDCRLHGAGPGRCLVHVVSAGDWRTTPRILRAILSPACFVFQVLWGRQGPLLGTAVGAGCEHACPRLRAGRPAAGALNLTASDAVPKSPPLPDSMLESCNAARRHVRSRLQTGPPAAGTPTSVRVSGLGPAVASGVE